MYKSGFVTIVGRPNVGKSTLTNQIMGEKLSIVSNKPQTTRNNIQTILTGDDYQLVFVDTPGIHKPKNKLGDYMVNAATSSIKEVDLVVFIINPCDEIGRGDKFILEALKQQKAPVFLVVNKVDENSHEKVAKTLDMYSKEYDFAEIVPVSALKGTNTDLDFSAEDKLIFRKNKWIISHEDNAELIKKGVFGGIYGENYTISEG